MRFQLAALALSSAFGQLDDPTPLAEHEKYLEPYLDNLVSYRDSPIARRMIALTNLVDVVPTWLEDLFVPLFIPGSSLTIPMQFELPLLNVPPSLAHLEIDSVSIDELNEFKKLKPAKFQPDTRFTWAGQISWKETASTTLKLGAKLVALNAIEVGVNLTFTVKNPAIDFAAVVAFDREKMCGVWGHVMESSGHCAMWPLFVEPKAGVSGVNMTSLVLHASDFSLEQLDIQGLPFGLGDFVSKFLKAMVEKEKPTILEHLSDSVSAAAQKAATVGLLKELPAVHKYYPCSIDELEPKHVDVSTVCFTNNAAFAMKWGYANCPTHDVSQSSKPFPIDQHQCMKVTDIWADAKEGEVLRAQVEAIAGIHEIIDPALRYVPNSNVAAFECDGTTLLYKCKLVSVVPEDPSAATEASQICILNHGGYVMHYDAQNQRTGAWMGHSKDFPIDQTVCTDLATLADAQEGDTYKIVAHADGGKDAQIDRNIVYKKGAATVTAECTGTTLGIKCEVLARHPGPALPTGAVEV